MRDLHFFSESALPPAPPAAGGAELRTGAFLRRTTVGRENGEHGQSQYGEFQNGEMWKPSDGQQGGECGENGKRKHTSIPILTVVHFESANGRGERMAMKEVSRLKVGW